MSPTEKDLFDSVLCGILRYSMDDNAQVLQFNSTCTQLYGFQENDAFASALESGEIQTVYTYDREIFRGFFRRCIRTGQVVNFGHRILRKDGTLAYIMGTMRVATMEDGEQVVQAMFTDSGYHVVQEDIRKSLHYLPVSSDGREKLIVASPDEDVRRELKEILMPDCTVIDAATEEEVRSILNKEQDEIGAVLVDEDIVSNDDFRFMASIKSNTLYASIPVVIIAREGSEDEKRLLSYGASEFLRRPFDANVIRLRISNLLELRDTAIQRNAIESLVDNIPGGVVIFRVGSTLELLYDSKKIGLMGGWTEDDRLRILRDGLGCLIYEADRARVNKNLFKASETGSPLELTFRLVGADGKIIWVQAHSALIRKEGNKPVYQSVITPTSVREKMYQNVLDDSFSAVAVNDEKTDEQLYLNNAAAVIAEECDTPAECPWMIFRHEELCDDTYLARQVVTKKTGRHLTMNGRLIDWNGIPARIVFLADDTESYRLQNEQLERALSEAKKANEAKSSFLSRMSHDIRTPLNAILGMASLALDEISDPEAIRDYLEKISSSGQYLLSLINDILDMSRIESNHVELNPEPGDVGQCIHDVLVSMRPQLDQKKIAFNFVQLPDTPETLVMLDKMRIQQVFFNLLSNAAKFTPDGGSVSVVVSREYTENNRIRYDMKVSDTGIGIAEDAQERIFEPFEQAGPQTKNGTGLGLAIVKNLIDLMGGEISVESTPGEGTTFRINVAFPISAVQSVMSEEPEKESVDFRGRSVLVVEDNPINMEITRKLLERKGCKVTSAYNGQDAVDIVLHCKPGEFDAVLMDIQMPVLNGLDASRKIRESGRPDIDKLAIIAMTANAFEEDIRNCREAGMDKHLAKPIEPKLLYDTLQQIWSDER